MPYIRDSGCTANLVNSNVVRSVRFGANWNNGNVNLNANNAPANANANYGGDLWSHPILWGVSNKTDAPPEHHFTALVAGIPLSLVCESKLKYSRLGWLSSVMRKDRRLSKE